MKMFHVEHLWFVGYRISFFRRARRLCLAVSLDLTDGQHCPSLQYEQYYKILAGADDSICPKYPNLSSIYNLGRIAIHITTIRKCSTWNIYILSDIEYPFFVGPDDSVWPFP